MPQIVPFDFGEESINSMDMVSAHCTVNKGDLPIDIYWVRNGHKLFSNDDGIIISKTNKRISVLSIESVGDRHSGNYTCVAENLAGAYQHSAQLFVNGSSFINKNQQDLNIINCFKFLCFLVICVFYYKNSIFYLHARAVISY